MTTASVVIAQVIASQTHYEVLGVAKDASPNQLKSAYRTRALLIHPDKLRQNVRQHPKKNDAPYPDFQDDVVDDNDENNCDHNKKSPPLQTSSNISLCTCGGFVRAGGMINVYDEEKYSQLAQNLVCIRCHKRRPAQKQTSPNKAAPNQSKTEPPFQQFSTQINQQQLLSQQYGFNELQPSESFIQQEELKSDANTAFERLHFSYSVLSDPSQRKNYDESLLRPRTNNTGNGSASTAASCKQKTRNQDRSTAATATAPAADPVRKRSSNNVAPLYKKSKTTSPNSTNPTNTQNDSFLEALYAFLSFVVTSLLSLLVDVSLIVLDAAVLSCQLLVHNLVLIWNNKDFFHVAYSDPQKSKFKKRSSNSSKLDRNNSSGSNDFHRDDSNVNFHPHRQGCYTGVNPGTSRVYVERNNSNNNDQESDYGLDQDMKDFLDSRNKRFFRQSSSSFMGYPFAKDTGSDCSDYYSEYPDVVNNLYANSPNLDRQQSGGSSSTSTDFQKNENILFRPFVKVKPTNLPKKRFSKNSGGARWPKFKIDRDTAQKMQL